MMDVKTVFYLSRWEETSLVVTGAKGCVLSFLIFVSLCFPSFCLFSLSFSLSLSKQIQLISERFLLRFDSWKKIKFSFWEKIHLLFTFLCHCVFWSRPFCLSHLPLPSFDSSEYTLIFSTFQEWGPYKRAQIAALSTPTAVPPQYTRCHSPQNSFLSLVYWGSCTAAAMNL